MAKSASLAIFVKCGKFTSIQPVLKNLRNSAFDPLAAAAEDLEPSLRGGADKLDSPSFLRRGVGGFSPNPKLTLPENLKDMRRHVAESSRAAGGIGQIGAAGLAGGLEKKPMNALRKLQSLYSSAKDSARSAYVNTVDLSHYLARPDVSGRDIFMHGDAPEFMRSIGKRMHPKIRGTTSFVADEILSLLRPGEGDLFMQPAMATFGGALSPAALAAKKVVGGAVVHGPRIKGGLSRLLRKMVGMRK